MMYAKCGGIVGGGGTINTILISNCIFHSSLNQITGGNKIKVPNSFNSNEHNLSPR